MSDKFYVGLNITGFENTGISKPVSRVTLMLDDENALTAGDDSGSTLEASCPHATQEMVDGLLAKFRGYQYQSYAADAASIDPAAELGDGITVGGIYSVISAKEDDGSGFPNLSAPGSYEGEEDFPADGPMENKFNHQIAQTRSLISKTAEEIRLAVENELGNYSTIKQTSDAITAAVSGLVDGSRVDASITAALEGITLSVSSSSGSSTFEIKAGETLLSTQTLNLSVDAVNISGTINADQINASELHVNAANIDGTITAGNVKGDAVNILDNDDIPIGTILVTSATSSASALEINSYNALRLISQNGDIYLGADYELTLYGEMGIYCQNDLMPSSSSYTLGTADLEWKDVYAAGTTLSALVERVNALENK